MANVTLKHVYKIYENSEKKAREKGKPAVSDFCMEILDKEFIVFVGPSGCGKSTTLRMIAGLEEISDGEIWIDDTLINEVAPKDRDIAMVFQSYALYPHMTVYDNMAFSLKLRRIPDVKRDKKGVPVLDKEGNQIPVMRKLTKAEIDEKVMEAARILAIEEYLKRKPKALSGGQRQRVALGRTIVRNPKVFLLDEPLSNLDAKLRATMRSEIIKLHEKLGATFIYVTHDQVEAMTMGTRIVVMKDGFVQQIGAPQELYDHPINTFVAGFIGTPQMNFLNGTLVKKADGVYFVYEGNELKLPADKANAESLQEYIGQEVVAGLRPECIHDDEISIAKCHGATVECDVDVTELMGAEIYLYLTVGEEGRLTARVSSRSSTRAGEKITVGFDMDRMHFFDKDTERCFLH